MLIEKDRIGKRIDNTGLDTYESCFDKEHFKNYSKKISYEYNSKGFRDVEWPTDLSDCIWCIGDSFTEGLGQPFEETWPQVLQKNSGKTCRFSTFSLFGPFWFESAPKLLIYLNVLPARAGSTFLQIGAQSCSTKI